MRHDILQMIFSNFFYWNLVQRPLKSSRGQMHTFVYMYMIEHSNGHMWRFSLLFITVDYYSGFITVYCLLQWIITVDLLQFIVYYSGFPSPKNSNAQRDFPVIMSSFWFKNFVTDKHEAFLYRLLSEKPFIKILNDKFCHFLTLYLKMKKMLKKTCLISDGIIFIFLFHLMRITN